MRVVYLLTSLGMGGAERQVLAVAERMVRRGHTVAVLVLRPRHPAEWPTDLPRTYLGMRKEPLGFVMGLLRGLRFLRSFRPELVHSHTYPGNMVARAFKLLGPSTVLISTIHNVYEGGWLRMLAYRLTDPLSAMTTAVSAAAAERFVQWKAVPRVKCRVLVNGIDTAEFAPDAEQRCRMREKMAVHGEFVWLAAGRLMPAKDYPNLLKAFAIVTRKQPSAQLWIAGEGLEEEALRALAAELGLKESLRWLGLRRDLPALLDAADGFVLASAWEGMPLAVGEAMAMEKPVVATDVGGVRELVGEAGQLVHANSPEQLAEAMLAMMQKPVEERKELGQLARERITAHFSIEAKADEWEKLYDSLLRSAN